MLTFVSTLAKQIQLDAIDNNALLMLSEISETQSFKEGKNENSNVNIITAWNSGTRTFNINAHALQKMVNKFNVKYGKLTPF